MGQPEPERVYTPKEFAKIIRSNMRTVLRMIERGEITDYFKVGNRYRIRQSAVDKLLASKDQKKDDELTEIGA